jgi:hypothetical protein
MVPASKNRRKNGAFIISHIYFLELELKPLHKDIRIFVIMYTKFAVIR